MNASLLLQLVCLSMIAGSATGVSLKGQWEYYAMNMGVAVVYIGIVGATPSFRKVSPLALHGGNEHETSLQPHRFQESYINAAAQRVISQSHCLPLCTAGMMYYCFQNKVDTGHSGELP